MTNINDLSCEELRRVVQRDRYIMDSLSQRLSGLIMENATLMAVIQESQQGLAEVQQGPPPSAASATPPAHIHPPEYVNADGQP